MYVFSLHKKKNKKTKKKKKKKKKKKNFCSNGICEHPYSYSGFGWDTSNSAGLTVLLYVAFLFVIIDI